MSDEKINTALDLVMRLYEHLEYCNWGDSWERECSEELREEATKFIEKDNLRLTQHKE